MAPAPPSARRLSRLAAHVRLTPPHPTRTEAGAAAAPSGAAAAADTFKMVFWGDDDAQVGIYPQLCREFPELDLVAPTTEAEAAAELKDATCAWGRLSPELLAAADGAPKLVWLHNPRSAPPVGYYFPELEAHPVFVTNARGMCTCTRVDVRLLMLQQAGSSDLPVSRCCCLLQTTTSSPCTL